MTDNFKRLEIQGTVLVVVFQEEGGIKYCHALETEMIKTRTELVASLHQFAEYIKHPG